MDHRQMIRKFLEATAYGFSDILAVNYETQKFATKNGGKYRLSADGTVKRLAGPAVNLEDRMTL
jgi:hypothetical protein